MPEGPNRRRAKVRKQFTLCRSSFTFDRISCVLLFISIYDFLFLFCPFPFQTSVTLVLCHHTTKTFTHFTSVTSPSQPACLSSRCFPWPSPRNESRITCCTTSPAKPFSGNEALLPHLFFFFFFLPCMFRARPNRPEDSKNTWLFVFLLVCL